MATGRHAYITIQDEVNCTVTGLNPDHAKHLWEVYGVLHPNHFFHPKVKLGSWDGKIRFFHTNGTTFVHLLEEIVPKLVALEYEITLTDNRVASYVYPSFIDDKYFAHIINDETDEPYEMWEHQVRVVNTLIENGSGIAVAATGAGKAQPLTSKLLTPSGWICMGDVAIGMEIVDPTTGRSAPVLGVFPQGVTDVYQIEFHDGTTVECCGEHLWDTHFPIKSHSAKTERKVVSTRAMLDFMDQKKSNKFTPGNISIPLTAPIVYSEYTTVDPTIDPYLLGLLIGDGTLHSNLTISSKDEEIINAVTVIVNQYGLNLNYVSGVDYRITHGNKGKGNPLVELLKQLNLWGCLSQAKFLPPECFRYSVENREALIQGLMDSDGTVDSKGNCSYTTVSRQLSNDVANICRSLGMICTVVDRGIPTNGNYSRLDCYIQSKCPSKLFRLSRKQTRCRETHADGRIELTKRVVSITQIADSETQCIYVDSPSHLYVTDGFNVTHNTMICASLSQQYINMGLKVVIIVPSQDLIEQTRDDFTNWNITNGEYSGDRKDYLDHNCVISTWQALKNVPQLMSGFDVVIVDECHGAKAKELSDLLLVHGRNIAHRFGVTGTIPKAKSDAMTIHNALGSVLVTVTAAELIAAGVLSTLDIVIKQLEEDFTERYQEYLEAHKSSKLGTKALSYIQYKDQYFGDYDAEKSYIQKFEPRLMWIAQEIQRLKENGNTFVLVDGVPFGKKLASMIPGAIFVHGKDKKAARKQIYKEFRDNDNLCVIATVNIASTGINIKRIYNLVLLDIGKSFTRVIQSIGRGLRRAPDKDHVDVVDLCSDLKYGKKHCTERIKYYNDANYPNRKTKVENYARTLLESI